MIKHVIEPGSYFKLFDYSWNEPKIVKQRIESWSEVIDDITLDQLINLSQLPLEFNIKLMADGHAGYGMPIGGVIAVKDDLVKPIVKLDPLGVIIG
jgi:tRNA-splicing ligase RtcB